MGLRGLIRTATVEIPDSGSFTVRGFSPRDGVAIYNRHSGELSALFDHFAAKGKVERGDAEAVGAAMIAGAPRVMAEIIVVAHGVRPEHEAFDEEVEATLDFPAGVQLDALQKIAGLTFTSEMPPGKFLAVVLQLAQSATVTMRRPAA